jgi:hypothetical protein
MLRALDEPVTPRFEGLELFEAMKAYLVERGVHIESESGETEGRPDSAGEGFPDFLTPMPGVSLPRDFDLTAAKSRFDQLAERLGEDFGACGYGHAEGACFGSIVIPAQATRTRAKRTRVPCALGVLVSSFGGLATYRPVNTGDHVVPVHPDDRRRIEEALDGLGYQVMPRRVLDLPYDGPNGWIFGPSTYGRTDATWFDRFFD